MSEQQNAQAGQPPEQEKQPMLVNKQGEVSAPHESATSAVTEATNKDQNTTHQTMNSQKTTQYQMLLHLVFLFSHLRQNSRNPAQVRELLWAHWYYHYWLWEPVGFYLLKDRISLKTSRYNLIRKSTMLELVPAKQLFQ